MVTAEISGAWVRMPAMKLRAAADSWCSSSGSWKALSSPSNSEMCVCMALPGWSAKGLGMKVARTTLRMATSLIR